MDIQNGNYLPLNSMLSMSISLKDFRFYKKGRLTHPPPISNNSRFIKFSLKKGGGL
jgi:hypothetical protein